MTIAARFHRALFVAGLFAVFGIAPTFAAAPSPQAAPTTQVPGYYRFTLGTFRVTALSDGTIDIPFDALLIGRTPNQTSAFFRAAYARNFLKLPYETSVNAYLVDTGTRVILIDTGAGTFYGPTLGNLLVNLRAAGYQPGQVSDVLITHMHSDHIGGLLDHGAMAFPNATVWVGKADYDFWLDPANLGKADPSVQDAFATAGATFAPYIAAHRVQTIVGNSNLYPGIDAVASPGHSPGHHFYTIQSAGQQLVIWGDVLHSAPVQFANPEVTVAFDYSKPVAYITRALAFADEAHRGYFIAASHLPFPGIGHVTGDRVTGGYLFVPVNYSANRPEDAGYP